MNAPERVEHAYWLLTSAEIYFGPSLAGILMLFLKKHRYCTPRSVPAGIKSDDCVIARLHHFLAQQTGHCNTQTPFALFFFSASKA